MARGTLFFIVGASGVGKDTLIGAAMRALGPTGRYVQARRVITRAAGPGEDHEPVSADEFTRRAAAGGFLHQWEAHGLRYGLPASLRHVLAAGCHVIANGSRASLPHLAGRVSPLAVIEITAPAVSQRDRILARGRESGAAVEARLAREAPLPADFSVVQVSNDGTIEEGGRKLIAALESMAA